MLSLDRERALRALAAGSLALVLVVIVASAAIRLSEQDLGAWMPLVRGTHRASASLATLLILAVSWLAWRAGRRALAAGILVLTVALSILGAATGISPPRAAQAGNLLGGLALAALLARLAFPVSGMWGAILVVLSLQACLGAWLSIFADDLWSWTLLVHALLGIALAAMLVWTALRRPQPGERLALMLVALVAPAAGAAAALLGAPAAATVAHAVAVAALVIAAVSLDPYQGRGRRTGRS
jgi:hypothetical protein